MWKFEQERINQIDLNSKKFKYPIPVIYIEPIYDNQDTSVIIFNSGIGGANNTTIYMNNPFYNNHYLVSYEKAMHGNNKNKPSQFKKPYLKELDEVVEWVKTTFPNKKIYLLGESWGTALNLIYYKKNKNKINGVVGWNMPTSLKDPEKRSFSFMWGFAWRYIVSLIFNVDIKLPQVQSSQEKFSQNKLFARLLSMIPPAKTSSKVTLAVWKCMRPSLRFLKKYSKDPSYNFAYIQSEQDIMCCWRHMNKVESRADSKHYIKFKTGYHVLSMEPVESNYIYQEVEKIIKN